LPRALSLLLAVCTIHGFKKEKVDMLMPQVAPQKVSIFVQTNSNVINKKIFIIIIFIKIMEFFNNGSTK
jgi:hypothetical protein